jgi:hypothetical protein
VNLCLLTGTRSTQACSASPLHRPKKIVADDDLTLIVNLEGNCVVSQRGRDVSLGIGDAALISHTEPTRVIHDANRFRGIIIPHAALAPLVADLDYARMRVIPRHTEGLTLLLIYLDSMQELALTAPELRHSVATHILDLVALAIRTARDGAAIAWGRGVRTGKTTSHQGPHPRESW